MRSGMTVAPRLNFFFSAFVLCALSLVRLSSSMYVEHRYGVKRAHEFAFSREKKHAPGSARHHARIVEMIQVTWDFLLCGEEGWMGWFLLVVQSVSRYLFMVFVFLFLSNR